MDPINLRMMRRSSRFGLASVLFPKYFRIAIVDKLIGTPQNVQDFALSSCCGLKSFLTSSSESRHG
jgi:hypothetical protein